MPSINYKLENINTFMNKCRQQMKICILKRENICDVDLYRAILYLSSWWKNCLNKNGFAYRKKHIKYNAKSK